jgi:hypothetical protein
MALKQLYTEFQTRNDILYGDENMEKLMNLVSDECDKELLDEVHRYIQSLRDKRERTLEFAVYENGNTLWDGSRVDIANAAKVYVDYCCDTFNPDEYKFKDINFTGDTYSISCHEPLGRDKCLTITLSGVIPAKLKNEIKVALIKMFEN